MEWINKLLAHKKVVLGSFVTLILCLLLIVQMSQANHQINALPAANFKNNLTQSDKLVKPIENEEKAIAVQQPESQEMKVDIKGAVQFPGVYPAKNTDRVQDVIKKAQPLKNADLDMVNLSQKLNDGHVIYIPYTGEVQQNKYEKYQMIENNKTHNMNQKKININQAQPSELEEIPGIGPKKAEEIMQYRENNQGFKSIEEIKEIKGIGEKTFEKLKDYIEV